MFSKIGRILIAVVILACLVFILTTTTPVIAPAVDSSPVPAEVFEKERQEMVDQTIIARGVAHKDVIRAMRNVPRDQFVPSEYRTMSYTDRPLPIGYGQTISQPYIVALMTELIEPKPGDRVLEIGTGSGYQASILAEIGYLEVYSIEIIPELAKRAAEQLKAAGYSNVKLKQGDGYFGWPEYAPFNAILVTAAPDHLPSPLVEQLAEGGRIIIPIGPTGGYQTLWKFVKRGGELNAINIGEVSFVPLTRGK